MITPRFELNQTATSVIITIFAPYANVKDADVYVDGTDFRFACPPYYLRLIFPGELTDIGSSNNSYDGDRGAFIITLEKVNKGHFFDNLDLISTLLVPSDKVFTNKPDITVLDSEGEDSFETDDSYLYTESVNCLVDQTVTLPPEHCDPLTVKPKYGFANQFSQVFRGFECEAREMLDLEDADSVTECYRRDFREKTEVDQFSDDHYLADRYETDNIDALLNFVPTWQQYTENGTEIKLSDDDVQRLKDIKVREYLLTTKEKNVLLLGLMDIMAAYCYNYRTTEGETTSESGWTINKLSSTLSWFDEFETVRDVLIAFLRRSLCYPLHRNWDLSVAVVKDLQQLLKLGVRMVLKCLLEIHKIFNKCPPRYILNRLYIEDYCVWIQSINADNLSILADKIDECMPCKEDLGLDIVELETAADLVVEEEEFTDISTTLAKIALGEDRPPSVEASSSSSASSSEDEDEDCSSSEEQSSSSTSSSSSSSSSEEDEDLDSDDLSS